VGANGQDGAAAEVRKSRVLMTSDRDQPYAADVNRRIETLILALGDDHVSVRWNAARELARVGSGAVVALPVLNALLEDRDATSALWARYAIARISGDTQKHLSILIAALGDRRIWPGMAAFAIAGFGAEGRDAVAALTAELTAEHPDNRWSAAGALANIGPDARTAVPALIGALADADEKVRWYAAWALGSIGPDAALAVRALVDALDDVDEDVRGYAALALGRIGAPARIAIPRLQALLDVDHTSVSNAMAEALQQLNS